MQGASTIADPPRAISVAGYAIAHFGKSLWWNGSELLLAFYLTEYLRLEGWVAGLAIAGGLAVGAAMDIAVARRPQWFASVPRAGRMQIVGAFGSLGALIMLLAATGTAGSTRLMIVIAANVVYRLAYVFYDLPQNCMLGLVDWSLDQQRKAASARTAGGAGALVMISLGASLAGSTDRWPLALVMAGTSVALASAWWLWRATRGLADIRRDRAPATPAAIGYPLAMMAIVCLTVPAFSKLAPYLASYARLAEPLPLLVVLGIGTALSQPAWLAMLRRSGERTAAGVAGILLVVAALAALLGTIGLAAVFVGVASGGLGTAIWAGFAAAVANDDPLSAAPAFARLTATAKIALAIAAIGIGALLSATDYRGDGARLLPFMTMLMLAGGIAVIALSCGAFAVRRGKRAGSA